MMTDEIRRLLRLEGDLDHDSAVQRNAELIVHAGHASWRRLWFDIAAELDVIEMEREVAREELAAAAGKDSWAALSKMPRDQIEALRDAEGDAFKRRVLTDLLRSKKRTAAKAARRRN